MGEEDAVVLLVLRAIHCVARAAVEVVAGNDDVGAICNDEIVIEAFPESIACDGDAARVVDLHIHLNVAEDIASDRHIALGGMLFADAGLERLIRATAEDADIRRAGGLVRMLDGAARDGDLANRAPRGIEENIRRWGTINGVIALDIAGADVDIAHISAMRHDASAAIVTDVTADDVGLVEIDVVIKNADAAIVIQVAICDQNIAVPDSEMHGVAAIADAEA